MPSQHSTEQETTQEQGIVVPLELEGLRILKQEMQPDGTLRIEVIGTNERAREEPVTEDTSTVRKVSIPVAWGRAAAQWKWKERAEAWDDFQRDERTRNC